MSMTGEKRSRSRASEGGGAPLMHTLRGYTARYVGKSDPTFVADNARLDRELTAARVSHLFELYVGGHTTALWQAHAVACLSLALDHLQAPVK